MKKIIVLFLAAFLIAGCARIERAPVMDDSEKNMSDDSEESTVEVLPEIMEGVSMVENAPYVLAVFHRGDTVEVAGMYDNEKAIIKTESGYALMEKAFLTSDGAQEYTAWQGYPRWNAKMYDNCYLYGESYQKLTAKSIRVLDELENCYVIEVDNLTGYMAKMDVSRYRSGGGAGGSEGGADGGDITLAVPALRLLASVRQEGEVTGLAVVKADGAEAILGSFGLMECVHIVSSQTTVPELEGYYTVYEDGLYGYVRKELIDTPDAEAYKSWFGYSKWGTEVYNSMYCYDEIITKLGINTSVEILRELESCYFVRVDDITGFVSKEQISDKRFSTGGGSGSSSGGEAWSPPML